MTTRDIQPRTIRAQEMYGDYWFNSEPVPITALRGTPVLLFFWDYSCGSSLHALPYVRGWNGRYRDHGLTVVGIHAPRFSFGLDPQNVQKAIARLGVTFPVVMDNNLLIWSRYDIRAWPTLCIVDRSGFVRYMQEGEGGYLAAEREMQMLLLEGNLMEDLPDLLEPMHEEDRPGALCYKGSPEVFTGYVRGTIGNVEGSAPESRSLFHDPELYLDGRVYLDGAWLSRRDSLLFDAEAQAQGQLIVPYVGLEVVGVFGREGDRALEVTVEQDDRSLSRRNKGDDVRVGADGKSVLMVDEPRLYSVVKNTEHGSHVLRLRTTEGKLAAYSFKFVPGVIPVAVSSN
jgi:thiol-disulfide isomerase/thioredoxin